MTLAQRWRAGRASYRPAGEPICTRDYDVAPLPGDGPARAFVLAHHYSGSYPAARRRFGLFRQGELVGVAVLGVPCRPEVVARPLGLSDWRDGLELSRFVLRDDVPANGETWFLGRVFRFLRAEGFAGLVSFSDPCPRHDAAGRLVFPGHLGTIYQAHNGRYLGRGSPRTLRLLPNGQVLSERALQKVRSQDQGWRYAAQKLVAHGADEPPADGPAALRAWLAYWLPLLTWTVRHRGCHRYAWALARSVRLPPGRPFPKQFDAS